MNNSGRGAPLMCAADISRILSVIRREMVVSLFQTEAAAVGGRRPRTAFDLLQRRRHLST